MPTPPGPVTQYVPLQYQATNRQVVFSVDMKDTQSTSKSLSSLNLLAAEKDENGETVTTFAGREYYWNNQLRKQALEEGLDKFVPQILYLVRPETAFTSCLHFLAKQLGGVDGYMSQREFIHRNLQLLDLMKPFWSRVQETYWSGGFSPGIGEEDRLTLILSLIECYLLSEGYDNYPPVPDLRLSLLHEAGIYLPSIEYPDWVPTQKGMDLLHKLQKRDNFPGLPNPLGSYINCSACGNTSLKPGVPHKCIPKDKLICTPCGLKFGNHDLYKVHVLTFCKRGPLTQSKCACCNTPGPECICTAHWKRTHHLAREILDGKIPQAQHLANHGPELPATLIEARTLLGMNLIPNPRPAEARPPQPIKLRESLWNADSLRFPEQGTPGSNLDKPVFRLPNHEDPCSKVDLDNLLVAKTGRSRASWDNPEGEDQESAQESEKESEVPQQDQETGEEAIPSLHQKFFGTEGIDLDNASAEDFDRLDEKIKITEERLANPRLSAVMSSALKIPVSDLQEDLTYLKELHHKVAQKLLTDDVKDRKEKLQFRSPVASPAHSVDPLDDLKAKLSADLNRGGSPVTSPKGSPVMSRVRSPNRGGSSVTSPGGSPVMSRVRSPTRGFKSNPSRRTASKSPGRTATSVRGSSRTHTLMIRLERAMQVLRAEMREGTSPKSTAFKRKHEDLKGAISKVEQHLSFDDDVDPAYSDYLEGRLDSAEHLLDQVDDIIDQVQERLEEKRRQQEENRRKEAQVAKCLPRSPQQKWDGSALDFIKFKDAAMAIVDLIPDQRLAMNAIIDMISEKTIRKRISRYRDPRGLPGT